MNVKLISITQPSIPELPNATAEDLVAYCARVSNPTNQNNIETAPKLLKYLIKHRHWSPFEMVSMTLEIKTSRAIAAQILRHRSFSFQEFSQRYSEAQELEELELRKQAIKNRQSSVDTFTDSILLSRVRSHLNKSVSLYNDLIHAGAARESARMVLPLTTETTMYMAGTARSWVHYIDLRSQEDTQKEHRDIALAARKIFADNFPNVAIALEWDK